MYSLPQNTHRSAFNLLFIVVLLMFASATHAQTMSMPSSSNTSTFVISLTGVYQWELYEFSNNQWGRVDWGYRDKDVTLSRSNGYYSYKLNNCISATYSNGTSCITTPSQNIVVATTPAVPTNLVAFASNGSVVFSWNADSNADRFEWKRDPGIPITTEKNRSITDLTGSPSTTYTYSVRACFGVLCSNFAMASPVTLPAATGTGGNANPNILTQNFTYDGMGRLTFVKDSRTGMNRDYDYDWVGNRMNVVVGTDNDSVSVPDEPTLPRDATYRYWINCQLKLNWYPSTSPKGGVFYLITFTNGTTVQTAVGDNSYTFACPYNTQPDRIYTLSNLPYSVKACISGNICSLTSYFSEAAR